MVLIYIQIESMTLQPPEAIVGLSFVVLQVDTQWYAQSFINLIIL